MEKKDSPILKHLIFLQKVSYLKMAEPKVFGISIFRFSHCAIYSMLLRGF
jgi:hypothetical protein